MDGQQNRKRPCTKQNDKEPTLSIPFTHCCKCHIEMIDKLVISIHVEYKKTIAEMTTNMEKMQNRLKELEQKMKEAQSNLSTQIARWKRDVEIGENTVSSLRQIIRNICEDVQLGKEPRQPLPIKSDMSFPTLTTDIRV